MEIEGHIRSIELVAIFVGAAEPFINISRKSPIFLLLERDHSRCEAFDLVMNSLNFSHFFSENGRLARKNFDLIQTVLVPYVNFPELLKV